MPRPNNDGRVPRAVGQVLRQREREVKARNRQHQDDIMRAVQLRMSTQPKPKFGPRVAS